MSLEKKVDELHNSGIKGPFKNILIGATTVVLTLTAGTALAYDGKSDCKAPIISNLIAKPREEDPFGDQRLTFLAETFKGNEVYLDISANGKPIKKESINAIEDWDKIKSGGIKADGGVRLVLSELFDTNILDSNIYPYHIEIKIADNPEFGNATVYASDITQPTPIFGRKCPETVRKFEELLDTLFKSREEFLERHKVDYNRDLSYDIYTKWEWSYMVSNKIGDKTIEARVEVYSKRRNIGDRIFIDLVPGPEVVLKCLASTPKIQKVDAYFRDKRWSKGFTIEEVLRLAGIEPIKIGKRSDYSVAIIPSVYLMVNNVKNSVEKKIYSTIKGEKVKQNFYLTNEQFYVQPIILGELGDFKECGWDDSSAYIGVEYRYYDEDMNFKKEPVKEIDFFTDDCIRILVGNETNNILYTDYLSSSVLDSLMPYDNDNDKKDYISIPDYSLKFKSIAEFNEINESEYYKDIISKDFDKFEQFIDEVYSKYLLNEDL